ncbi:MAG: TGS domain-containing protein [Candidatus Nitrosothermus koennekii]|nr:MAG: TGS domain-containing protein [Candidatus Nitrosothermus koennekii]
MWYLKLIEGNREKISRAIKSGDRLEQALAKILAGIGVKEDHIIKALKECKLETKNFDEFDFDETKQFAWALRDISKPTLIVANKIDIPTAAENFKRMREEYKEHLIVPASAEAELTLRRAENKGLIRYVPGDERFEVIKREELTDKQKWALNFIRRDVLGEYMRTGVQHAINVAVFKLLKMNTVYPVADVSKLADKDGNVLPDVYLLPAGSTVEDLAKMIHTDLAKGLLYAIDARDGLRLPTDYQLKDRDVISIVSAAKKK